MTTRTDAWDYTPLASTYDHRPDYSASLVKEVLHALGLRRGTTVAEVGAGTGKLTTLLLDQGLSVLAMEPNASMRGVALAKPALAQASWVAARGESLPLCEASVQMVAYGSSFNVIPARAALDECARVLQDDGVWLAMWNHRDLGDPMQKALEQLIRSYIPAYDYGRRRAAPDADIVAHGAFGAPQSADRRFTVEVRTDDWMTAWRSHATLSRQAGERLPEILRAMADLVGTAKSLIVPYRTSLWFARRRPR